MGSGSCRISHGSGGRGEEFGQVTAGFQKYRSCNQTSKTWIDC